MKNLLVMASLCVVIFSCETVGNHIAHETVKIDFYGHGSSVSYILKERKKGRNYSLSEESLGIQPDYMDQDFMEDVEYLEAHVPSSIEKIIANGSIMFIKIKYPDTEDRPRIRITRGGRLVKDFQMASNLLTDGCLVIRF